MVSRTIISTKDSYIHDCFAFFDLGTKDDFTINEICRQEDSRKKASFNLRDFRVRSGWFDGRPTLQISRP